jgi:hypothetical protein
VPYALLLLLELHFIFYCLRKTIWFSLHYWVSKLAVVRNNFLCIMRFVRYNVLLLKLQFENSFTNSAFLAQNVNHAWITASILHCYYCFYFPFFFITKRLEVLVGKDWIHNYCRKHAFIALLPTELLSKKNAPCY